MLKRYWKRGAKQKTILIILGLIVFGALFFLRDDYQPFLLFLRKYLFIILLCVGIIYIGIKSFRKGTSAVKKILFSGDKKAGKNIK